MREVAAVAAGVRAFSTELGQTADQVLGPSQWEPGVTFPNPVGPTSDWFLNSFQNQFGRTPDYIAAGSFATGLVLTECIRLERVAWMTRRCETCVPVCPVSAIFALDDLPEKWKRYMELNASYVQVQGGKFTPKSMRGSAAK